MSTDNLLGFSNKYVIDVSKLDARQRTVVQEIVSLYESKNKARIELMESDSITPQMISLGYANEFDIDEYKKQNGIK